MVSKVMISYDKRVAVFPNYFSLCFFYFSFSFPFFFFLFLFLFLSFFLFLCLFSFSFFFFKCEKKKDWTHARRINQKKKKRGHGTPTTPKFASRRAMKTARTRQWRQCHSDILHAERAFPPNVMSMIVLTMLILELTRSRPPRRMVRRFFFFFSNVLATTASKKKKKNLFLKWLSVPHGPHGQNGYKITTSPPRWLTFCLMCSPSCDVLSVLLQSSAFFNTEPTAKPVCCSLNAKGGTELGLRTEFPPAASECARKIFCAPCW